MRLYTNYSDVEFADIRNEAEALAMTPSLFQKYCVMLYLKKDISTRSNTLSMPQLINEMFQSLSNLKPNSVFIISSLFPPETWSNLSPADKRTLACILKKHIVSHTSDYSILKQKRGTINQYKKH